MSNILSFYDITYEECERIFNMMKNTQEIANEVDRINSQWGEIDLLITKLIGEINTLNAGSSI